MSTRIQSLQARRIWDSRGRPTVEVDVHLDDGTMGRGIAPAGASTGSNEAIELRDGGTSFGGYDVQKALANVMREIAPAIIGHDALDQRGVDDTLIALDGTSNKARLGGNALIATSMAVLHAAAASQHLPLWRYLLNTTAAPDDQPVILPLPEIQILVVVRMRVVVLIFRICWSCPLVRRAWPRHWRWWQKSIAPPVI